MGRVQYRFNNWGLTPIRHFTLVSHETQNNMWGLTGLIHHFLAFPTRKITSFYMNHMTYDVAPKIANPRSGANSWHMSLKSRAFNGILADGAISAKPPHLEPSTLFWCWTTNNIKKNGDTACFSYNASYIAYLITKNADAKSPKKTYRHRSIQIPLGFQ